MSERRAIFIGGPWDGRQDIWVRDGTLTVNTTFGGGVYDYRDHGQWWVGYVWQPIQKGEG